MGKAAAEGEYDDFLIDAAEALKASGRTPSRTRLTAALRDAKRLSLLEASRAVEDFSERGVLQARFGPSPCDVWLTAELEKARRLNQGINSTILAKKLQRDSQTFYAGTSRTSALRISRSLLGFADARDVVDDYLLRYGLKPILGPYPYYGIAIVTVTEALLFLPMLWAVHYALGSLLGHPLTFPLFGFVLLLFIGDRFWKNWRKLRSPERWSSYDAARERLPLSK